MALDKTTKNAIYKESLIQYRQMVHTLKGYNKDKRAPYTNDYFGLCKAITNAIDHLGLITVIRDNYRHDAFDGMDLFPEIYKHYKPASTRKYDAYYWNRNNTSIRVRILNKAIKDTQ